MKKNETYVATCTGYNEEGSGVVRIEGIVIFVPNLLEGEEALIAITAMKKKYGYGRVVEILKQSPHRIKPICDVYRLCGGCQLLHMDREEQNHFKIEKVKQCFRSNASMEINPLPIITAEPYTHYRNKVQIPVQVNDGQVEMGFYQKHTNKIIPFKNCYAESELSNAIVADCRKLFTKYHNAEHLKHILIKHAYRTNQVMLVFITKQLPIHASEEMIQELLTAYPMIRSISAVINQRTDNVILDGKEVLLYGTPYIEEELLGSIFRISARSFFQINPFTTPLLYQTAIDYADLKETDVLVDLYCGTGTMGIIAAKKVKKVYGIEIVPEAIIDAKKNAAVNHVENIEFMTADAQKGAQWLLENNIAVDAMIVDPPRKGCSRDTLDAIVKISPKRLVYVSCDPSTLARDVKILCENKYEMKQLVPCDMFPGTFHVETVVLLSRKEQ